jgi:hypothetical protein
MKGYRIPAHGATLGIHPKKQSRVLKERGIISALTISAFALPGPILT